MIRATTATARAATSATHQRLRATGPKRTSRRKTVESVNPARSMARPKIVSVPRTIATTLYRLPTNGSALSSLSTTTRSSRPSAMRARSAATASGMNPGPGLWTVPGPSRYARMHVPAASTIRNALATASLMRPLVMTAAR
jgi:hypothetical protein